jgi:hypothetical protein
MIERVIRISAELEGKAIVDRKRLRQSSIEVHQSGTIERIAGSVSIRVLRRQREGITIDAGYDDGTAGGMNRSNTVWPLG